jgi:hypothetical protein
MTEDNNALQASLMKRNVEAHVVDLDYYRIRGGMAVETDYIILVKPKDEKVFDDFK